MKITKLTLIEETDTHYIFSISFKSFFGEKTRVATKEKRNPFSHWANTGDTIMNDYAIDAWLTTDKKDFTI